MDEAIKIKWQEEPGGFGATVEEVISKAIARLNEHNAALPCRENSIALTHLETAKLWLKERTRKRIVAGVEGSHQPH